MTESIHTIYSLSIDAALKAYKQIKTYQNTAINIMNKSTQP